jgi:hypothetical protein
MKMLLKHNRHVNGAQAVSANSIASGASGPTTSQMAPSIDTTHGRSTFSHFF